MLSDFDVAIEASTQAVDALLTVYWADSLPVETLEREIACLLLPYLCMATRISDERRIYSEDGESFVAVEAGHDG